jgi:very-short-patch-repair endonuclease
MRRAVEKARKLQKAVTTAEQRAWRLLRDRNRVGLKFRRQHPIGKFVVDFYCQQSRLAVELDGSVHAQPRQASKDLAKDADLKRLGIRVLRLPNGIVLEDPEMFCKKVLEAASENFFKINE